MQVAVNGIQAQPPVAGESGASGTSKSSLPWKLLLPLLTLAVSLVHGYHPFAEDGGLYVAGIEYRLDPSLFPHDSAFVQAHLRFSWFASLLAGCVQWLHFPLPWVLLAAACLTTWLMLLAAKRTLQACGYSEAAQLSGVLMLVAWWTLPIAGTSLLLMDPYVTARSFAVPLSLLGLSFALRAIQRKQQMRTMSLAALCFAAAGLFHPLMAAYGLALALGLAAVRSRRPTVAWLLLALGALATASVLQSHGSTESSAVRAAVVSRYYWFLSQWRWFEVLGLLGPLAILAVLSRWPGGGLRTAGKQLCRACVGVGSIATIVTLLFAREGLAVHPVARLQPLRAFLLIYVVMAMLLGAALQSALTTRAGTSGPPERIRRFGDPVIVSVVSVLATIMFLVQRAGFPASPHLELPWRTGVRPNAWVQAFLWIAEHTPHDALFAVDAKYVNEQGEDAQTFRAIARRSMLPDYSKDGGVASITPALAERWQQGADAQRDLSLLDEAARDARLRPLHVDWMVLHAAGNTHLACPYRNGVVKVCRLR